MSGMLTRAGLRAFSTTINNLKVVNNVARQQFMISMHGDEAVLDYKQNGNSITFIHTNVPLQFQGKGAGKLLADHAFKYAQEKNLKVICQCHFLCKYYELNRSKYGAVEVTIDGRDN